ncbi:Poly-beta-1,6-N-acetyl-D-glucosamine synthase [Pseudomonas fluorescens]|uniref:glycosyltransferase family 2 protein n=1 Tax=Pseudomonas fluorescens TaxID=294 RepID=UPI001259DABA|nr:glycosyltransferase family 2 protein [Pseudomonas fluorescens]VVQ14488.1 Poly-beta-1,6-N-acetyl-D-glucosamine synthase [Pseudomonas fluorescens]
MGPLLEQLYYALGELAGPDGLSRLFYMLFPLFMIFELPMTIMVLLGVLRWFARRRSSVPKISTYRPRVSCIITCYSEGMDVQTTLLSLCEQTYPGHIEMIPVVDGATMNQATLNAVRRFHVDPQLYPRRHLRPIAKWQRGGRVSSLNAGLSLASGEIVMALDGDTSFDNNMVSAIVRHFEDPSVPAVAGSLRVRNVWASWVTAMQALEYLLSIHMSKIGLAEWNLVNNVSGAFGAFRRSFLVKIGGWNTHTAEDLDLTLRIKSYFKRHNLRIPFEPEAIGHTDAPATLRQFLMQRLRWDGDLFFLYVRKHNHNIDPKLLGWPSFLMILVSGFLFSVGAAVHHPQLHLAGVVHPAGQDAAVPVRPDLSAVPADHRTDVRRHDVAGVGPAATRHGPGIAGAGLSAVHAPHALLERGGHAQRDVSSRP